ncbi:MAG: hypothetical protein JXR76_17975 [Deltaproteobacteria bacterium]|nr:hypothetical protein [Deltaproteobacteria bacterium]
MTEQPIAKQKINKSKGVILNGRFVHRDIDADSATWVAAWDAEEMILKLAEYFALNDTGMFTLPLDAESAQLTDDMPRFQKSQRDGLQVPKEGQDGTGN